MNSSLSRYFLIAVLCGGLLGTVRHECKTPAPTYSKTTMYVTDLKVSDPAPAAMVAEMLKSEHAKDQKVCDDSVTHMRNLARCYGGI